jgi:hypothetical protein
MGSVQGSKLGKENASAVFKALDGNGDGRLSRQVRKRDAFLCLYVLVTFGEGFLWSVLCSARSCFSLRFDVLQTGVRRLLGSKYAGNHTAQMMPVLFYESLCPVARL